MLQFNKYKEGIVQRIRFGIIFQPATMVIWKDHLLHILSLNKAPIGIHGEKKSRNNFSLFVCVCVCDGLRLKVGRNVLVGGYVCLWYSFEHAYRWEGISLGYVAS
jgi:hypothetical protein